MLLDSKDSKIFMVVLDGPYRENTFKEGEKDSLVFFPGGD